MNLIASERETWRRHRRIMGPPFNNMKTYPLVWNESMRIYRDMVYSEGWEGKDVVHASTIQHQTFNFTLLVICACGFGWPFAWSETRKEKSEGKMSLQQALRTLASSIILGALPKWAYNVPVKAIQDAALAKDTLARYMTAQIKERKEEVRSRSSEEVGTDMFSLLVQANETDGKFQLDDDELAGNVFGLLFAGHETTAHTLAASLGFLGIYPDIQQELYEEIMTVVGPSRDPTYEDMPGLEKVRAVFFESVRLYPAGYVMIREATEDTVLTIPTGDADGGESGTRTVPIGKGAQVVVDMVGVQYNPRYFPDPDTFKPSRWYGVPLESESVTAFSIGPRTCLGRKFATVEAVCFLTLLLRDWEVKPVFKEGEGPEEYRERMMQAKIGITLGVQELPVTLVRRAARK
ncbi:cytochrome P450 [Amylostereum chailletii]|nr:cytochrome P450 [Amylostereum chailletii]